MRKLLLSLLLFANSAHALLPPLWESVSQIKAVLSAEHLKDYLDSAELIESIERIEGGFLIKTNRSELKALVKSVPHTRIGPGEYEVEFIK